VAQAKPEISCWMTGYGEVILFGQNQKLENEEVVIL